MGYKDKNINRHITCLVIMSNLSTYSAVMNILQNPKLQIFDLLNPNPSIS